MDQRHNHFRTRLRVGEDVAGVVPHVGDQNRLAQMGRCACQSLPQRDEQFVLNLLGSFQGNPGAQRLGLFIEQKNAEIVVIDDAADDFTDFVKQGLGVQDRAELPADLSQQRQVVCLPEAVPVEPRVFNGHGNGRGQQGEEMLNLLAEIALGNRLQVHHADGLPFCN